MKYDFDKVIERDNTNSVKWNFREKLFGSADVLPMWVADMDFRAPQPVIDALVQRASHGIYGYSEGAEEYYEALEGWMRQRHGWEIEREWVVFTPGIVPALNWLLAAITRPGDKVALQSPVYPPFFGAISNNGCETADNPLKFEDGEYRMDFADLEVKLAGGVKALLLCSPHNPVGRVWQEEEIRRLGELCLRYGVTVISDEIHSDLVYPGYNHRVFASLSPELARNCVVCTAPSKTFNLAGLQVSNLIIPNPELRKALKGVLARSSVRHPNSFGIVAMQAAYRHGAEWLDQLMLYLHGNLDFLTAFLAEKIPEVKLARPEGTYLAWLDFRQLGMNSSELQSFLIKQAKLALNDGAAFGPGGEGFARMNIACPRSILAEGLQRLERAVRELG